jgi:general secretion pathway protein B
MSFILDALKKSETERQRGDAPGLYEVKMAPPRHGVAPWLIVLASLLVINIVVLSVVLLRGTHGAAPASDAGTVAAPAPPAAVVAPTPAPAPAPTVITPPPAPVNPPAMAQAAPDPGTARPSDDDAPAVEPSPRADVQATGGNSGELPTYQQAATAPGANVPELALNLHSYSTNPADRFIFLNMTKLREGQASPQGVRVETITPDGAILSWQGSKFLLQRQ